MLQHEGHTIDLKAPTLDGRYHNYLYFLNFCIYLKANLQLQNQANFLKFSSV